MDRGHIAAAAWVLGFLVAYVLSIGPMAYLFDRGYIPMSAEPALTIVYSPLQPIARSHVAGPMLSRYVEWWLNPRVKHYRTPSSP